MISLHFAPNPFFSSEVLSRSTSVSETQTVISCSDIAWHEGQVIKGWKGKGRAEGVGGCKAAVACRTEGARQLRGQYGRRAQLCD